MCESLPDEIEFQARSGFRDGQPRLGERYPGHAQGMPFPCSFRIERSDLSCRTLRITTFYWQNWKRCS